ncbi:hypothetical protein THOG05_140044 [Vibrio rotiferianus]|nr:hypothetical protein THOG05_140044 [Vibrio rotiferianus]CAH1574069.1 hypothetical protein THOG10_220008 [Vibrio rotiferianus]CAH1576048.1 hypothetical protein THOB06_220008 [Vibrio rotiferianus]CAH1581996.1 hypothetical protein THOE12_60282 [Vibrio rotiferianus]
MTSLKQNFVKTTELNVEGVVFASSGTIMMFELHQKERKFQFNVTQSEPY